MAAQQRRWSWYRLSPGWAERLVADAGVGAGDLVVDVGAGTGAITRPLLRAGARVVAVVAHPGRADALRALEGVVVVRADARDLRLPRRPFHVVANPPFDITTPLLRRLLHPGSRLQSAHLVLQEQAARRWAAHRSRSFALALGPRVRRTAFTPAPPVDARVLVVTRIGR